VPYKDPAMQKAQRRNRDHVRRSAVSDITAAQELAMRAQARECPLCGASLTSEPNRPDSKHLDHIIPLGIGGTHTHGNVRIICFTCNIRRPKDGSDYSGPVTLWAQGPPPARPDQRRNQATCKKGLHPWVPENIHAESDGRERCAACRTDGERARRPRRARRATMKQCGCGAMFAAPGRTAMCPECTGHAARRAAELHAAGMPWSQVADQVGYSSAEGARYAAKRIGYTPARPASRHAA
jgi:5-methylcytosine-specific restriction endonuclease McrA